MSISANVGLGMNRRFVAGLGVSAVAAGLLIFDLIDRGHVDGWAIALLAFAALPWFWEVIETVGTATRA